MKRCYKLQVLLFLSSDMNINNQLTKRLDIVITLFVNFEHNINHEH